jgi:hypothetical protein
MAMPLSLFYRCLDGENGEFTRARGRASACDSGLRRILVGRGAGMAEVAIDEKAART